MRVITSSLTLILSGTRLEGSSSMKRITNRTALLVAQDFAQMALAATGWRRQVYWRAAMGEMRRAYNREVGQ